MDKFQDVDSYIASYPSEARTKLEELRAIVKANASDAKESISYGMAYYSYNGKLLYFGGFKNHIGFFVVSADVLDEFKKEIEPFLSTPNTIHFALDEPLPKSLIERMVSAAVADRSEK